MGISVYTDNAYMAGLPAVRRVTKRAGGDRMIQPGYSNKQLLEIAKKSYENMVQFCQVLGEEGYWEEPEHFLHQNIYEMLDMYLQALMLNQAVYCGENGITQRKFIVEVVSENLLGCPEEGELPDNVIMMANKLLRTPPIILQLCGVRDGKKQSFFSSYFFDSLLNILLSISLLDHKQSAYADKFITEFYEKNVYFVNEDQRLEVVNARYLFLKLSTEKFYEEKAPVERLKEHREQAAKKNIIKETKEKEEGKNKTQQLETKDIVSELSTQEDKLEQDVAATENIEQEEETKERTIFDYTDEELQQLQKMGKLKISTPAIERLKKEQQEAMKKLQDERLEQIKKEINKINHAKKLQELLDELNGLVGLENVKSEIQSLINLIKVKKMRESYDMPSMNVSYHMVFTGNPGTGKTTVARLVAKIYKELGILSKGQLVEVDRAGLVAGYVGQTAIKVQEVAEKAMGGILFIDEAYALSNKKDANDFGGEAIDTLVKIMEDHRDDLVVIVAGYKNEMEEFLKANTGLISRFNKFIDFKDYTTDELMMILDRLLHKSGLCMSTEAAEQVRVEIEKLSEEQKFLFGNGRGIRNTFESILGNQANRIVNLELPTQEQLMQIELQDVLDIITIKQ